MGIDEFLDTLNRGNPHYSGLSVALRPIHKYTPFFIERKGENLVELIADYLDNKHVFPLVDKKLGMVFGMEWGSHMLLKCELYRYHTAIKDPSAKYTSPNLASDSWVLEGMGYYFASTRSMTEYIHGEPPRRIIAAQRYRPDRFDKDLFMTYEVEYTL